MTPCDTQAPVPLIQWIRGMCSDEEPHEAINAMLATLIDAVERVGGERDRYKAALEQIEKLAWFTPAKIAREALNGGEDG